ncbi:MAG: phosphatase PAP2 family protein [Chloroflexi bacterium]|nr:phosphatase PAP2 family protein [Chloroflexota bacterium]MBP8056044.1 phosphatase PAP2 family protein [Chloroflexota bacterium]
MQSPLHQKPKPFPGEGTDQMGNPGQLAEIPLALLASPLTANQMKSKFLSFIRHQTRHQLVIWFVALILFLGAVNLFWELAESLWQEEALSWDITVMRQLHDGSQPWLDEIFWLITLSGGPLLLLPLFLLAFNLWQQGKQRRALLFIVSFLGTALLNSLLKTFFARPRPDLFPTRVISTGYSFPSGHTMAAAAFFGMLALFFWQQGRYGGAVLAALWIPLVALSRVYLGAHYPSDVLASLALGMIWLIIVWFTYTGQHVNRPSHTEESGRERGRGDGASH